MDHEEHLEAYRQGARAWKAKYDAVREDLETELVINARLREKLGHLGYTAPELDEITSGKRRGYAALQARFGR